MGLQDYDGPIRAEQLADGVFLISRATPAPPAKAGPDDAADEWQCVDCSYTDTERSLICPNCATDGALMGGDDDDDN